MDHGKQHYIAQCYLKAWCDPSTPSGQTPYVWQFPKDGGEPRRKAPENILFEREMYTIKAPDGTRDLTLEHGLQELEDLFVSVRDTKLVRGKALTSADCLILCAFVSATHTRTKAQRNHLKGEWGRAFQMMERMKEAMQKTSPQQQQAMRDFYGPRSKGERTLSYDDVKALATEPLQTSLASMVSIKTSLLYKIDLAILRTADSSPGFITSDAPCVWSDPQGYKRPPLYRAPALIYPTIEVSLPVTPNSALLLNRQGLKGIVNVQQTFVDEINRRTRFHAYEYFIVNMNVKRDSWFDPGEEPEDSWDKQHRNRVK